MFEALDINVSGLIAQRERLTAISGNIANFETILNEQGAYERHQAVRWASMLRPSSWTREHRLSGMNRTIPMPMTQGTSGIRTSRSRLK